MFEGELTMPGWSLIVLRVHAAGRGATQRMRTFRSCKRLVKRALEVRSLANRGLERLGAGHMYKHLREVWLER